MRSSARTQTVLRDECRLFDKPAPAIPGDEGEYGPPIMASREYDSSVNRLRLSRIVERGNVPALIRRNIMRVLRPTGEPMKRTK